MFDEQICIPVLQVLLVLLLLIGPAISLDQSPRYRRRDSSSIIEYGMRIVA